MCGKMKDEHDLNLQRFLKVAAEYNLMFNKSKCTYSSDCISLLGYEICKSFLRPDQERVKSLLNMPIPTTKKELPCVVGLFAYYARWLQHYSNRIKPLVDTRTFPMTENAIDCYYQ